MAEFKSIWQSSNGVYELHEFRAPIIIRKKNLSADFNPVFSATLIYEGGYENQSTDPGTFTGGQIGVGAQIGSNLGISAATLARYLGKTPSVDDMKNLTKQQAQDIARKYYWNLIQGDSIQSQALAAVLFDGIWSSGYYGTQMMRKDLNQTYNKTVADETSKNMSLSDAEVSLINNIPNESDLFNNYMLLRKKFVQSIPGFATYGTGWLNRLDSLYNRYFGTFTQQATAFVKKNIVPILVITLGVLATIGIVAALNAKDKTVSQPIAA